MRARHTVAVAVVVTLSGCGGNDATEPPVGGNRVELAPDMDNTLYEDPLGQLSNGAGEFLFAGVTNQPLIRRATLRFNVAGAPIPPGATIDSVRLTLYMSRSNSGGAIVSLHRLTTGWGEQGSDAAAAEGQGGLAAPGDATWLYTFYNTSQWTSPGGDFDPTPSASAMVLTAGPYVWKSTPAMVADVQAWRDAPARNFGWIVIGDETGPITTKRFDSRENAVAENRPKLTVYFTP